MEQEQQGEPTIYEHSAKKEWGRGTLIVEAENKRQILWEDESVRNIHMSHWDRLIELELSAEEKVELDAQLRKRKTAAEAAAKRAARKKAAAKPKKPPVSFVQQLDMFAQMYPQGFQDPAYVKNERGSATDGSRDLKEEAIARAQELFARDRMKAILDRNAGAEIFTDALKIPEAVKNMLHYVEAGKLTNLPEGDRAAFGQALFDLLHGDGELEARFDAFVATLKMDPRPTWTVATIFQAFYALDDHVFVKPTFWLKQALVVDKDVPYDPTPDGKAYAKFVDVARETKRRLEAAGLAPRDLMDVYTFTWRTLSPKAIKAYVPS